MIIGVLKEIKKHENRVSLLPVGVEALRQYGHTVLVQKGAGVGSEFPDSEYVENGAKLVDSAEEIYAKADMILKVKEPQPSEYGLMREGQIIFTFFHYSSCEELTRAVIESRCFSIAYETVTGPNRTLPLLAPMSEVAGRMAVHQGARYLQREKGGRGILIGGVPGVAPATVLIIGGGIVGTNAARMAAGLGAQTYIMDISPERLRYLSEVMPSNVVTLMSNSHNIREYAKKADIIINGILIPGAKAPKIITRKILQTMKKGSAVVDVAIDQGGGLETSRPTDLENPVYIEDGVVHYCVTNMPGAVPVTSTIALTNATLPYVVKIANEGHEVIRKYPDIAAGANIIYGKVTHRGVAEAFDLEYTPLEEVEMKSGVRAV